MATTYSSWLQDVSVAVPGAPKDIVTDSIKDSIRDFCQSTLLWVKQLDAINIVAGTATYTLTAPAAAQASVVNIDRAEFEGSPMGPESMDVLDRSTEAWRQQTGPASYSYMVDAEKVLRLRYIPTENKTGALVIWAALKPLLTATILPDFLYDEWYECILNTAIAALFGMPRQVFTNIQEAEYFGMLANAERSRAKAQKTVGKTKLKTRVQPYPFEVV